MSLILEITQNNFRIHILEKLTVINLQFTINLNNYASAGIVTSTAKVSIWGPK